MELIHKMFTELQGHNLQLAAFCAVLRKFAKFPERMIGFVFQFVDPSDSIHSDELLAAQAGANGGSPQKFVSIPPGTSPVKFAASRDIRH